LYTGVDTVSALGSRVFGETERTMPFTVSAPGNEYTMSSAVLYAPSAPLDRTCNAYEPRARAVGFLKKAEQLRKPHADVGMFPPAVTDSNNDEEKLNTLRTRDPPVPSVVAVPGVFGAPTWIALLLDPAGDRVPI
jgi:hypothetical protein